MPAARRAQGLQLSGQISPGLLPTAGINARDAAIVMGPQDALDLVNVFSEDYGLTVRNGYQEFATGLPGTLTVATLMSYYPATAGPSFAALQQSSVLTLAPPPSPRAAPITLGGQLFACTGGQIYDITAGGAGPWVPQPGITATSDFWTWVNFQNAGGAFLLVTNDEGKYVTYGGASFSDGFSDGFSVEATGFTPITEGPSAGQISGINPDLFVYVMVWKQRVWFIEKDSTRAWYLPVGQITGTVTQFDFGSHFRHGGRLQALVNWTLDGGAGIDDHLVAFSSEGDVVIFKGYDPDQAADDPNAFQLVGIWYVGALPKGRRQVSVYGGDVYVLSIFGISQISKLVAQANVAANLTEDVSSKIDPLIARFMLASHEVDGWYLIFLPSETAMVVGLPSQITGESLSQLVMKIRRSAWSKVLDVPVITMLDHDEVTFGGGAVSSTGVNGGGNVYVLFDAGLDNVPLAGDTGNPIRARMLPSYNAFGSPGMLKSFPMVRLTFNAPQVPGVALKVLTDFTSPDYLTVPSLPPISGALWDVALWDSGKWAGQLPPIHKWFGTVGAGFSATVQADFTGYGGTRIMAVDWWTMQGGPL
jgi:hypothetical protein